MRQVNHQFPNRKYPVKILQFGEGNFLRAFVDYMVDIANERGVLSGGVAMVKPIAAGSLSALRAQDCVYTVLLRGRQNGADSVEKRVVTCVSDAVDAYAEYAAYEEYAKEPDLRFTISNTTEAGIVYDAEDSLQFCPPKTYPGKLTKFLYERFRAFDGAPDKGLIILPVELIEKNGDMLRACCEKLAAQWQLSQAFHDWLSGANIFCNTLVDRIVTGYPKEEAAALEGEFNYTDQMLVCCEPFALWVIESGRPEAVRREFPLDEAGLPVVFTDNLQPYRERKVRILNGAHTATVLAAYLSGIDTVGEMMQDETMRAYLNKAMYGELAPMVPLPEQEVRQFADSVVERFQNPFIRHNLLSIALNSVSKFKARLLPTILETQERRGRLPQALCFSLAALMAFYSGRMDAGKFIAQRGDATYEILDDAAIIAFFNENHSLPTEQFVNAFLANADFWGQDLNAIPGLCAAVGEGLSSIREKGMRAAVEQLLKRGL